MSVFLFGMNLTTAQSAFTSLVNSVSDHDRLQFLSWCKEQCQSDALQSKVYLDLRAIAEEIKTIIPTEAIFPSEHISNENLLIKSGNGDEPVVHIDSFLFEDEDIDVLVEEGKMSRNYCKSCGSMNTAPITFISHSASIQRIEFIFQYMLPDLKDKVLLDVGSRLGAILYGAYYYSNASKIVGVEINEELFDLQRHIIERFKMGDRIEVLCSDICDQSDVLHQANVIILNNVFECFMSKDQQQKIWKWFRDVVTTPGTMLVTVPSMEETLAGLETGIDVSQWLNEVPLTDPEAVMKMEDQDLLSEICLYSVI